MPVSDPFDTLTDPEKASPPDPAEAKRRLWRNLFLVNLVISLGLVGVYWLPFKFAQFEEFLSSPSVNLPQQGEKAESPLGEAEAPPVVEYKDVLPARYEMVNASSDETWVYYDFSRGEAVEILDPTSKEWDLAFRRSKVITNGGATNKFGNAGIIDLGEAEFDSVLQVPTADYVQDTATRTETENPALLKWFKYNFLTHKLTAKKNIYALRTSDNKYAKVQFLSFYCANKETGCIKMRYSYQENGSNSFLKTAMGIVAATDPGREKEEPSPDGPKGT
ncbi:MAG: hypothetical protein COV67_15080 [Nitrospinae bacterium CG11_big_fil_rev_8_21_14_0_20_56_8]|nr:MAG: hypothetical protein COV67_15080 [Nitrospinae bacterium CG11_big_fil_rev_8_21_14_0_20_56_8]